MRFRLPRPLHGWRELAWEVGIIVIGVLIALSAQQVVEEIHWRSEVQQTRKALDAELGHNVAAFDYRVAQRPCVAARLAELKSAIARQRQGQATPFKRPVTSPVGFGVRTAVWEAASGEARSRMPIEVKLQYAALYDFLRQFTYLRDGEDTDWQEVEDADFSTRMDARDLQHVAGRIRRLEERNALLSGFIQYRNVLAEPLQIEPDKAIDAIAAGVARANRKALCTSYR